MGFGEMEDFPNCILPSAKAEAKQGLDMQIKTAH